MSGYDRFFFFNEENDAEIEFEQEQEQEAEQNATNEADQENSVEGPIVALFGDVIIGQVNVADQDIDQDIDQDQDQVIADVAANALAGVEDTVAIAFGDFDLFG
jgi:hypothetical protein